MEAFFEHIIKSAAILLLFSAFYYLFLRRETYFASNRWFLLIGLLASAVLPFVTLTSTIVREAPQSSDGLEYFIVQTAETASTGFQWSNVAWLLIAIYVMGICYFGLKLIKELYAINNIKRHAEILEDDEYIHVRTKHDISPFSFFKQIFYHPKQFRKKELEVIILHEKVHAKQLHTLDILVTEVIFILQWFNPVMWIYKSMVKQNLEFLADSRTCEINGNKKFYQYLVLQQAAKHSNLTIANPFYNSLTFLSFFGKSISWIRPFGQVKKRIVMLNQNQSKKMNRLKLLLILPFLVLFLMAFNTEKVYVPHEGPFDNTIVKTDKSIELIIDKNTSDDELEKIKSDLANDGIDFSYTVVHNDNDEIIDISIQISGKSSDGENFSGSYNSNSGSPIKPITIVYDDESNLISFGNSSISSTFGNKFHKKSHKVWVQSDDEDHKEIIIKKIDGKKTIIVDGKEVQEDELGEMEIHIEKENDVHQHSSDGKKIKVKRLKKGDDKNVFIIKESHDENESEAIDEEVDFIFMDADGENDMLYFIDGKKASSKEFKKINPNDIETVNVFKGDSAAKKYGKKAKNGVIEITTKKD